MQIMKTVTAMNSSINASKMFQLESKVGMTRVNGLGVVVEGPQKLRKGRKGVVNGAARTA